MEIYGIIGNKLDHSFSPNYFRNKFKQLGIEADYLKFELNEITELPLLISDAKNLSGLNVTVPFKEKVIPFVDDLSSDARSVGAVNTIRILRTTGEIKIRGYNTDVIGFRKTIEPLIIKRKNLQALVLGSGGSSKAVTYVLMQLGIPYQLVSRKPGNDKLSYASLNQEIVSEFKLIINTTPLGMFPDLHSFPDIPYHFLTRKHILYDLVYNPEVSQFLLKGQKQNTIIENGLKMLHAQADASWKIWQTQD